MVHSYGIFSPFLNNRNDFSSTCKPKHCEVQRFPLPLSARSRIMGSFLFLFFLQGTHLCMYAEYGKSKKKKKRCSAVHFIRKKKSIHPCGGLPFTPFLYRLVDFPFCSPTFFFFSDIYTDAWGTPPSQRKKLTKKEKKKNNGS